MRDLFLFDPNTRHDPGGKIKTTLPPHIFGGAYFHGERDQYRTWLSRHWGIAQHEFVEGWNCAFPILIGMNPSTADAHANDPTITREIGFVKSWGYNAFVKFNVADYRATHPKDLSKTGVVPVSEINLLTLRNFAMARHCKGIVACWGKLPKILRPHAEEIVATLTADGHNLWCLGRTKDGSPRHPLYLKSDTPLEPFNCHATQYRRLELKAA